jgi:ketosteroid isomerase-like protein
MRDKSGAWKILFDSGIDHPELASPLQGLAHDAAVTQLPITNGQQPAAMGMRDQLQSADAMFSNDAVAKGQRVAYDKSGSDNLRLLLENHPPVSGKAAVLQTVSATPTVQLVAVGGRLAHSGDLGYIYGLAYALNDSKRQTAVGSYMHVWQRGADGWKLLIALDTPFPPK